MADERNIRTFGVNFQSCKNSNAFEQLGHLGKIEKKKQFNSKKILYENIWMDGFLDIHI